MAIFSKINQGIFYWITDDKVNNKVKLKGQI